MNHWYNEGQQILNMKRLTKTKMVKNHLQRGQTITSLEAINLYGATRLSAIIFSLRQQGLDIATLPTTIKDRFGNSTTYAKYKLLDLDIEPRDFEEDLFTSAEKHEETKGTYNKNFLQKLWSKITSEEQ